MCLANVSILLAHLPNVYFVPKMTLYSVCSVFSKIPSNFRTILLYHRKSLLMKVLHTLTNGADFINMRSQYGPQHSLKISQ